MTPRPKKGPRLYTREQGGQVRFYADLRSVGRGRVALIPEGETQATTDPVIAAKLLTDLLGEIQETKRNKHLLGFEQGAQLKDFAAYHLVQKAKTGRFSESYLDELERRLRVATEFFGEGRELDTIGVRDVQRYSNWLLERPNGRGGTFSGTTARDYLDALSNVYRRAQSEARVPVGYNPVSALLERPEANRKPTGFLEAWEAALLLESARTYRPEQLTAEQPALPFLYPLLATYLLTGARESEILGLEVDDVSFDRKIISIRPNDWRRLKTKGSARIVPLFPQIEEILRGYVFGGEAPRAGGLLFPSPRTGEMVSDFRKALDAIATRAGWSAGEIRSRIFRTTYTAARLQTLDRGHPVSVFTVSRELGHTSTRMVEQVYARLGQVRHRAEVVEFRLADHMGHPPLRERLSALRGA
jgi:integrase